LHQGVPILVEARRLGVAELGDCSAPISPAAIDPARLCDADYASILPAVVGTILTAESVVEVRP